MLTLFRKKGNARAGWVRLLSVLLCCASVVTFLTPAVLADEESGLESAGADDVGTVAEESETAEPEEPEPEGVEVKNTYMLVVSTGAASGDSVLYFGVRYEDTNGIRRTEFVFPHEASKKKGYDLAAEVSSPKERLNFVSRYVDYAPLQSYGKADGLRSYGYDMFLFTCFFDIAKIVDVEVFMRHGDTVTATSKNEWTCSDLRLYAVNKLYGVEMVGYYSSDYYINFEGTLLAAFTKRAKSGGDFSINLADKLFRLKRDNSVFYSLKTEFTGADAAMKTYRTFDNQKELMFRLDIADRYGSGIEALASEYSDKRALVPELQIIESLTIELTYKDIYGMVRKALLPFITSAVCWALEECPDLMINPVVGFAQQGDTIMFAGTLPDYAELTGYTVYYGSGAAAKASVSTLSTQRRSEREKKLADDKFALTGISIFSMDDLKYSVTLDGAMLRCSTVGTPLYQYQSSSAAGQTMSPGTYRDFFGEFKKGKSGSTGTTLIPKVVDAQYIVEISTDVVTSAGTEDEVFASFVYLSKDGTEKTIKQFSLIESARNFFGYWPASGSGDPGYLSGARTGGKIVFTLNVNDVAYFKSVTLSVDASKSEDEWQMASIAIYAVSTLSQRYAEWLDTDATYGTTKTDRRFYRSYDAGKPVQSAARKALINANRSAVTITFDGSGGGSTDVTEPDWDTLKYSMTYNEARSDLGFTKGRVKYQINVQVASNSDLDGTGTEGDCGSVNLFYFQLVFADGNSAYVQANQQLTGDGFRAGVKESFEIITNRNYGELYAVRIIPDDTTDESVVYDKLRVEFIQVIQKSDAGVSRTWNVNGVGWIGIDFIDNGMMETNAGKKLRREIDMTRNYIINEKGYSLNFMVAMTTGEYPSGKQPLKGTITATVTYETNVGPTTASFDVAAAIAEYAERTPKFSKTMQTSDQGSKVLAEIDSSYMFRPNKVDRFIITLADVTEIYSIDFQLTPLDDKAGRVDTSWSVKALDIYQVIESGDLLLNAQGEYQRDGRTEWLCSASSTSINSVKVNPNGPVPLSIPVQKNTINIDQSSWEAVIESIPSGDDDVLNLYVYLGNGDKVPDKANISATFDYQLRNSDRVYQVKVRDLEYSEERGMLTFIGLSAKGMSSLRKLTLVSDVALHVTHAVVVQSRSNVVIDTYYMDFRGQNIEYSPYAEPTTHPDPVETQVVKLTLGEDTIDTELEGNGRDVAVMINYKSTNDVNSIVYSSPYIFFTEQEIMQISAGDHVSLTFDQRYVKEIVGISVVSRESVTATVDGGTVWLFNTSEAGGTTCHGQFISYDTASVQRIKTDMQFTAANLTELTIDVLQEGQHYECEDAHVKIHVLTTGGSSATFDITSLAPFVRSGEFGTDGLLTAVLLLEDVKNVLGFEISPVNGDEDQIAEWSIASVSAAWDNSTESVSRQYDVNGYIIEDKPFLFHAKDVSLKVSYEIYDANGKLSKTGKEYVVTGAEGSEQNYIDLVLKPGEKLVLLDSTVNAMPGYEGRGYDLTETTGIVDVDPEIVLGSEKGLMVFTPAIHYGSDAAYVLVVSADANNALTFTFNVTVLPSAESGGTGDEVSGEEQA